MTRRRVAVLEHDASRIVGMANSAGVDIEFLGMAPLFDEARLFVGEQTDWVMAPAQLGDTVVPKQQAKALATLAGSGLNFPLLYVAHEVPKGRAPESTTQPAGTLVALPSLSVGDIVGPVPAALSTVELSERLSHRAEQVFQVMGKALLAFGAAVGAIAAAPVVLAGAAVGALTTLDPVVFGALPAVTPVAGEPAAWFVLARWDW
ncbi:MAG TPA: hypothetical protein VME46_23245 [Acidimicrobiales bacterium]|nr:hypothetical protein [Acidimicrobiales bacterium]